MRPMEDFEVPPEATSAGDDTGAAVDAHEDSPWDTPRGGGAASTMLLSTSNPADNVSRDYFAQSGSSNDGRHEPSYGSISDSDFADAPQPTLLDEGPQPEEEQRDGAAEEEEDAGEPPSGWSNCREGWINPATGEFSAAMPRSTCRLRRGSACRSRRANRRRAGGGGDLQEHEVPTCEACLEPTYNPICTSCGALTCDVCRLQYCADYGYPGKSCPCFYEHYDRRRGRGRRHDIPHCENWPCQVVTYFRCRRCGLRLCRRCDVGHPVHCRKRPRPCPWHPGDPDGRDLEAAGRRGRRRSDRASRHSQPTIAEGRRRRRSDRASCSSGGGGESNEY
jgi:hypothetical protein